MTKIIFLMWLADIAGSIGVIGVACLIALAIGFVISIFALFVTDCADEIPDAFKRSWKLARWPVWIVAMACFAPNPSTIRLAAAGVAVQEVATTETAQKALGAFNAVLDRITEEAKKK